MVLFASVDACNEKQIKPLYVFSFFLIAEIFGTQKERRKMFVLRVYIYFMYKLGHDPVFERKEKK
jgi:hypothetical protein